MNYNKINPNIFNTKSDNLSKLADLFPSAVKDGELDIAALKEELGQFDEVGAEKYELTWAGKQASKKLSQTDVPGRTLKYIPKDSKNADTTKNLYIEGDNLEVLKLLRQNYYGAVKMIYIDPPYNTGNDFVYRDDFSMSKVESDEAEGETKDGERLVVNQKSSNRYHANWLNMMYPRLRVAKDLLREDGVICIQVDDNEYDNLKKLADEIYGTDNFLTTLCVKMSHLSGMKMSHKDRKIPKIKEYILIYVKETTSSRINPVYIPGKWNDVFDRYTQYLENPKDTVSNWRSINVNEKLRQLGISTEDKREEFLVSNAKRIFRTAVNDSLSNTPKDSIFREFTTPTGLFKIVLNKEEVLFASNKMIDFNGKLLPAETIGDIWTDIGINNLHNEGGVAFQNGKKPIKLIHRLVKMFSAENDIILDFFSGSATTAHAVMQLNAEDSGNRKFVMVQYPEICDQKSEAAKARYATICEIGKERIRRAGEKIKKEIEESNAQLKLDEEPKQIPDIGFRVFRTADTNIRWTHGAIIGQLEVDENMLSDKDRLDFMPGYTDVDVVYEIMLRQRDIPLSANVEKISIGKRSYMFADAYVVCLDDKITEELVEQLAAVEPTPIKYVFRDSAFDDNISLKDETIRRLEAYIARNSGEKKKAYTVEFI